MIPLAIENTRHPEGQNTRACFFLARAEPGAWVDGLAALFIIARVGYVWCYIADKPSVRSLIWMVGFGATVAIFVVAGLAK